VTAGAALTAPELAARLERLWTTVAAAGGSPATVTLVAVTKGFEAPVADLAASCGLLDLGENYAQELLAKAPVLAAADRPVRWHAIGRLQRNKVRALAPVVHLWQTVDRAELAGEIARRAPGARVLVQVNTSGEPAKGGIDPAGAPDLVRRAVDLGLTVEGLMTVGRTGSPEAARPGFAVLSTLADRLDLPVRCMGMSGDVAAAVQEGATMIRIGSALFGTRPPRLPGP
jgi:pyridoxal phosphate enzyme (YggS family)